MNPETFIKLIELKEKQGYQFVQMRTEKYEDMVINICEFETDQ